MGTRIKLINMSSEVTTVDIISPVVCPKEYLTIYNRRLLDNGNVELITATDNDISNHIRDMQMKKHVDQEHPESECSCDESIAMDIGQSMHAYPVWVAVIDAVNEKLSASHSQYAVSKMNPFNPRDISRYRVETPRYLRSEVDNLRLIDTLDAEKCSMIAVKIEFSYVTVDCNFDPAECKIRLPPGES